ncbi:hypothetical protein D5086_020804 [Populus alba]|uniref:Uncharacterized protein n=1 Tax=Populus alba TaxID=43335 RepID=A0ACC4BL95_POPAL
MTWKRRHVSFLSSAHLEVLRGPVQSIMHHFINLECEKVHELDHSSLYNSGDKETLESFNIGEPSVHIEFKDPKYPKLKRWLWAETLTRSEKG